MDFSYEFMLDIMSTFYDFFMGISVFLTKTPEGIWVVMQSPVVGGTAPLNSFSWSWFNPFLNSVSTSSFSSNLFFEAFRNFVSSQAMFDYGRMPIWQIILIGLVSFWFFGLVIRVIVDVFA